ncbi:MAG: nickel-type superoxide dismutase maturation protease [Planctomycetota bacterium]
MVETTRRGRTLVRPRVVWGLARGLRLYRVTGESMLPSYVDGELVWVDRRAYRGARPVAGDVVLARHPYRVDVLLLKRVALVAADGSCELRGDNPQASTDSRSFGRVPLERILGRVSGSLD